MVDNVALKIVNGNLLDMADNGEFDVIMHGCNCFNTMGSGIARQIRERYPAAYAADTSYGRAGDASKLGNWSEATVNNGNLIVINAYTQFNFNQDGTKTDHFQYASFASVIEKMIAMHGTKRIGIPALGMGLAGGDATAIMSMIEDFNRAVIPKSGSVTLVLFQP